MAGWTRRATAGGAQGVDCRLARVIRPDLRGTHRQACASERDPNQEGGPAVYLERAAADPEEFPRGRRRDVDGECAGCDSCVTCDELARGGVMD